MSVGELAITPKISLVAVCCSSDSLSSWNSRTFSMAMTAWSAKVSRSLICAGVKGRTSIRRALSVPMSSPWRRRGAAKYVREPVTGTQHWEIVLRADVGNVKRAMLAHPAKPWVINTDLDRSGYWTKMGARNHSVALTESQHDVVNTANPCGALDDSVEHRLHVRRRAADNAEYLGRCRLMLQRLAQFRIPLLELLETIGRSRSRSQPDQRRS